MKKEKSLDGEVESIWKRLGYKLHDNLRFLIDSAIVGTAYTVASKAIVDYGLDKISHDWINEKNLGILALAALGAPTVKFVGKAISSFYKKRKERLEEHKKEGISGYECAGTIGLAAASIFAYIILKYDVLNNFNINNEAINTAIDYTRNSMDMKTIGYTALKLGVGGTIATVTGRALKKLYQKRPSLKGWSRKKAIAYGTIASLLFLSCFNPALEIAKAASNKIYKRFSQPSVQKVVPVNNSDIERFKKTIEGYTLEQYVEAMVPFIQKKYKLKTRRDMLTKTAKVYAEADFKVARIYDLQLFDWSALSYQESEYRNVVGDPNNVIIVNKKKVSNPARTRHQMLESTIQKAFARVRRDKRKLEELRKAGFYIPEKLPKDIERYPKLGTLLAGNQFRYLIDLLNGDVKKAIGAWNTGPDNPNQKYFGKVEKKAKEIKDYLENYFKNKRN